MTKAKKRQSEVPTIRNFVAKNQWQRGGVHDKPNKAKRHKAKQQLRRAIRIKSDADFFMPFIHVFSIYQLIFHCFKL